MSSPYKKISSLYPFIISFEKAITYAAKNKVCDDVIQYLVTLCKDPQCSHLEKYKTKYLKK